MRGQGATEYLVLLAVVLIVALVSVALLGFFPGMASDARTTQSQSYWRGQARPFAILESTINATGGVALVVQNMEATGPYRMTTLVVGNATTGAITTDYAAGETKLVALSSQQGTVGALYDLSVNITYNTPNGIVGAKQYSTKNLIGKYV